MNPAVRTLTPVVYVIDLKAAAAFYNLIGFTLALQGDDGDWAWGYARCGDLSLLLASSDDRLPAKAGPVQLYCQTDDIDGIQHRLSAAEIAFEHLGYPDHAPGGEIRVLDPDDHVVMIAATTGAATLQVSRGAGNRSTILRRAAEAVRERGGTGHDCEIGEPGGGRCRSGGEVKLADTWGDSAWSCLLHADDVLFTVRSAYIATEDAEGLGRYLARRRAARS